MSGRRRAPSKRALEAQTAAAVEEPRATRSKQTSKKATALAAPELEAGISRGHAAIRGLQDDDMDMSQEEQGEAEPDLTLYCICLGFDTGEQPMIECGSCHNWFHFNCVGLNEQSAAQIEAYCCDICQEMGMGQTRTVNDAPLHAVAFDDAHMSSPSLSGTFEDDDDDDEPSVADQDDEEYGIDAPPSSGGVKRGRKPTQASKRARRKVTNAEDDDEYAGEPDGEEQHTLTTRSGAKVIQTPKAPKARRDSSAEQGDDKNPKPKAKSSRKPSFSAASPSVDPTTPRVAPPSDKTRTHCVTQLTAIFKSIFASTEAEATSSGVEVRAAAFAESVEAELFEGFSELDPKGVRSPRTKYVTKFRSLHFNLKTNAIFRSRISTNDLTPSQIVNMSNEDLLTPELRAMADSVRAASLKHSVKEVITAPTAKRTHKGEEEIDNHAAVAAAQEEKEAAEREKRQRSESISHRSPQPSPRVDASPFFGSPPVESPATTAGSPSNTFTTSARPRSSFPTSTVAISADDLGPNISDETPIKPAMHRRQVSGSAHPFDSASPVVSAEGSPARPQAGDMRPPPPPQSRSRSSFDMSSVWSKIKAAPKGESPETETKTEGEGDEAAGKEAEEDPAEDLFAPKRATGDDDDDFEAALLRGEGATKRSTTPPVRRTPLSELPNVWTGDVIVPDEGGFPAFGVQAAGRPFGDAAKVWEQLLPRGLTMDGRIPTQTAYKYLLECSFAPTRELIVVALMPDLSGPTEAAPLKPAKEKCLAKHAHVINFYVKKDRIGVIAPSGALKKIVKDIYVLPLRQRDRLPEWAELLEDSNIPEVSERDGDLLLAVLVVQKGVIPTVKPKPAPTPAPEPVAPPEPEPAPAPAPAPQLPVPQSRIPTPISEPAPYIQPTPAPAQPAYVPSPQSYDRPPPSAAYQPNGYGPPPPQQSYGSAPYSRGPPAHYSQPSPYAPQHSPAYPQQSPPYPQHSPPYGGARSPPYNPSSSSAPAPAIDASLLAGIDTSALSSLLANPSIIQSALAQTQQGYGQPPAQQYPRQQPQQQQQWGGPPPQQQWNGQQPGYGYNDRQGGGYEGNRGGGHDAQGYSGGQSPPRAGRAGYVHPSRAALLDPSVAGPPPPQHPQQNMGYGGQQGGYGGPGRGRYQPGGYGGHQQGYGQQGRGGWGGRGRGR